MMATRGLYDEATAHQNYQLGRFIERLKATGEWENTLLIVAADHGHIAGSWHFGVGLADSLPPPWEIAMASSHLTRIPLLVVWPDRIPDPHPGHSSFGVRCPTTSRPHGLRARSCGSPPSRRTARPRRDSRSNEPGGAPPRFESLDPTRYSGSSTSARRGRRGHWRYEVCKMEGPRRRQCKRSSLEISADPSRNATACTQDVTGPTWRPFRSGPSEGGATARATRGRARRGEGTLARGCPGFCTGSDAGTSYMIRLQAYDSSIRFPDSWPESVQIGSFRGCPLIRRSWVAPADATRPRSVFDADPHPGHSFAPDSGRTSFQVVGSSAGRHAAGECLPLTRSSLVAGCPIPTPVIPASRGSRPL